MEQWLLSLLRDVGLPIALVVFFVYRDAIREKQMTVRIRQLEGEVRTILTTLVKDSTVAMVNNSKVLKDLVDLLKRIPCLPCIIDKDKDN